MTILARLNFFLAAEVNDEGGGTGKVKEGTVFSSGCDDWYAIGRAGKGSHECSVNLAKVANRLTNAFPGVDCKTKFDLGGCSCAFTAYTDMTGELYENKGSDGYFITAEELNRGFICDLNINRSEFPSLDNTNKWLCKAGIVAGAIVGWSGGRGVRLRLDLGGYLYGREHFLRGWHQFVAFSAESAGAGAYA